MKCGYCGHKIKHESIKSSSKDLMGSISEFLFSSCKHEQLQLDGIVGEFNTKSLILTKDLVKNQLNCLDQLN